METNLSNGTSAAIEALKTLFREATKEAAKEALSEVVATMNQPQPQNRFLSVERTMELTDVSRTTLWHWERKGILKPVKIGRTVKYRESDVIALIAKGGRK